MNMEYNLQIGDMIVVRRVAYNHVGIYVGQRIIAGRMGDVVHNDKFGGVVLSSLAEFSRGARIELQKRATGDFFEREAIKRRALSLIGRKFDLLTFNCEHAATWAQSGRAESPQLQGVLLLAGFVAIWAALAGNK